MSFHRIHESLALFVAQAAFPLVVRAASPAERGRYLAEEVAKCGDSHTSMTPEGPDKSKLMKGAVLNLQPIQPIQGWHKTAPDLTPGSRVWTRWGEQGLVNFMETGLGPNGHPADPLLPPYKLAHEDAEAMVAYSNTLR